jgi:hypothetical protein
MTSTSITSSRAWQARDLPDPFHVATSQFGERLVVRYLRPGDAYGVNGVRADHSPLLVEVRHQSRMDEAFGNPGRVVVTVEAADLAASAAAGWELFDLAMPYALSTEHWHRFLTAFDETDRTQRSGLRRVPA